VADVDYLLVMTPGSSANAALNAAVVEVLQAVDEEGLLIDGEAPPWFTELHRAVRLDKSVVSVHRVNLGLPEEKLWPAVRALTKSLRHAEDLGVLHVVKLFDEHRAAVYQESYFELCYLEMRLRMAFTMMFLVSGYDFYNLLEDVTVSDMPDTPEADGLRDRAENQFFFISFAAYISLASAKRPTGATELSDAILNAIDFEDLQMRVAGTLKLKGEFLDFIAAIKPLMLSIEKFRNAIAHNRHVSSNVRNDYVKARDELDAAIDDLMNEHAAPEVDAGGDHDVAPEPPAGPET
jgi:hypothetical protein